MIYRSDVMMQQPQQQGKQVKPIKRSKTVDMIRSN